MAIEPNSSFPQSFSGLDPLQKLNFVWGHRYYHYLPSAFDDSLDLYEQITNFIEYLNQTKRLTDDLVDQWEQIKTWIINDGLTDAVKAKLDEWLKSGVIAQVFGQTITNQIYDAIRAVASGSPAGVYSNAQALQTAYPNGDTHIYITADDGNWNYWSDGAWHKGGLYQAPKLDVDSVTGENIKDKSVSSDDIGLLGYAKVLPTATNNMEAELWYPGANQGSLTVDASNIVFDKQTVGDNGILIPVNLDGLGLPTPTNPLQLYVDFSRLSGNSFTGNTDLYVLDESKNIKGTSGMDSSSDTSGTLHAVLTIDNFVKWNLTSKFYLLVAVHGGTGLLNVTNSYANYSNKRSIAQKLDGLDAIEKVTGNGSGIMPQYAVDNYLAFQQGTIAQGDNSDNGIIEPDNYGFTLTKNSSTVDFAGIQIPVIWSEPITATNPCYLNLDFAVTDATGYVKTELWLASPNGQFHQSALKSTTDTSGHIRYAIEKPLADAWNLNSEKYWRAIVFLFAQTGTLQVTNFFVNYTNLSKTAIEEQKELKLWSNYRNSVAHVGANTFNSYFDYGTTRLLYESDIDETLNVKTPYSFTYKKRNALSLGAVITQVVAPIAIDYSNTFSIRAKYAISNQTNFKNISLQLYREDMTVFDTTLISSTELSGELIYKIAKPLADAWNLNAQKFWVGIQVESDDVDVDVSLWTINNMASVITGQQLAEKTIENDQLLNGDTPVATRYIFQTPSPWNADESNMAITVSDDQARKIYVECPPSSVHDKGFILWFNYGMLDQFPDRFYFNGRARVSVGKMDLNLVDGVGNFKGSLIDNNVSDSNTLQDFSVPIDVHYAKQLLSGVSVNPRFGIMFAIHSNDAINAAVVDWTISAQPVYPNMQTAIGNGVVSGTIGKRTYLGKQNIEANTPSTHTGLTFVGFNSTLTNRQKLTYLRMKLSVDGNVDVIAATVDQYGLMVNSRVFQTISGKAGYNVFDFSNKNYVLEAGEQLFLAVGANNLQYEPLSTDHYHYCVVDDTHVVNQGGYSGNSVYDDGKLYPFYAETVTIADKSDGDTSAIESEIGAIRTNYNPIIKRDDGTLQRLKVDTNNNVYFAKIIPDKIAIFGNSLTKEHGDIGMAASDQYHDWYYLFTKAAKEVNPSVTVNNRTNIAAWEQQTSSQARQQQFDTLVKPALTNDTGLVIYQLIDNCNSADRIATFEQDAETLIQNTKAIAPNAQILWIAGWFVDDDRMTKVKQACANQGATLVDITAYKDDVTNKSYVGAVRTGIDGSTWTITNPGEASHPGDKGMQLIANKVLETLGL